VTGTGKGEAGGKEFRRVAEELRVRIADGAYPLDSYLPAQTALATEFEVSRNTVQRVLEELRSEGWIESRQGKGSRVIKNQRIQSWSPRASRSRQALTLGPLIGEAFEKSEVTLDVYTLTSESLDAHIRTQAERIRAKNIAPRRIALRVLLPTESMTLPYPRAKDDPDDPRLQDRLHHITKRHTESLSEVLTALKTENLVSSVELEIRHTPLTPTFKLYVINGEVLHGIYTVIEREVVLDDGDKVTALDVLGYGATLTHHVKDADPTSPGSVFVEGMTTWFESVWTRLTD
jgi:DNA-binding transcriptional regulator YhcF (GntR family)